MIHFKAQEKLLPGVGIGGESKFYASIVRGARVDFRKLAEQSAELSTVQTADVMAVVETFFRIAIRHLSDGSIIDMGQFGIFTPTLNSNGEESAEKVDVQSIKKLNVNYRPSKLLKKNLSIVDYKKLSDGPSDTEIVDQA